MVASRVAKHHEAAAQALQRKEYYPRARVFAEARQREEMKSAWEQREHAVCVRVCVCVCVCVSLFVCVVVCVGASIVCA